MSAAAGAALAMLGDETRRGVVETLARGAASAGEIAAELDATPATLTRHLRALRHAGLVEVSLDPDDFRRHVYRLNPAPFLSVRDWAEEVASYWTSQLASFAEHAETTTRRRRRR